MMTYILDWLGLLFRWFHVLAAIAWVGSSFYFVWIDNNLRKAAQWKTERGIKGDVWVIHGGGIYEFQKYELAPTQLPETLHWVKWESYSTWLSGIALLSFIYYGQASSYLLLSGSPLTQAWQAVAAALGLLFSAVLGYEALIRTPLVRRGPVFAVALAGWLLLVSFVAFTLFSTRAAAIHVGVAIGSIMVGNVFFGIIPAQKRFVAALENQQAPDAARAAFAKLRSTHNNYLTLPVILCMISGHYPMIISHADGWWLLIALCATSAYARHYFNLRQRDVRRPHILLVALLALAAIAWWARPLPVKAMHGAGQEKAGIDGMAIVRQHCQGCHAAQPTHAAFVAPPAGLVFANEKEVRAAAQRIITASVDTQYMPLGNSTQMTEAERQQLGQWLRSANDE